MKRTTMIFAVSSMCIAAACHTAKATSIHDAVTSGNDAEMTLDQAIHQAPEKIGRFHPSGFVLTMTKTVHAGSPEQREDQTTCSHELVPFGFTQKEDIIGALKNDKTFQKVSADNGDAQIHIDASGRVWDVYAVITDYEDDKVAGRLVSVSSAPDGVRSYRSFPFSLSGKSGTAIFVLDAQNAPSSEGRTIISLNAHWSH